MRIISMAILLALSLPAYALPSKSGSAATQHTEGATKINTQQPGAVCFDCEPEPPGEGGDGGGGGNPPSQPTVLKILQHKVNPDQNTVEIAFDNGIVLVIDESLEKVFVGSRTSSTELSLDAALLQVANGNSQTAALMKSELHALLSDSTNLSQFSREGAFNSFNSNSYSPMQGAKSEPSGSLAAGPGYATFNCMFDIHCRYSPRFTEFGPGGGGSGWYGHGFVQHYPDVIGGGGDYQAWKRRRDAACQSANENFQDAGIATGMMAGGCAASPTGAGLAVCGISGVAVLIFMNRAAGNSKICASGYPGPGNW